MKESSISDDIGRIGEAWFDLLANKARLLSGKIDPDRIGRDRVLEFPTNARTEIESFDVRAAPLGCSIQIKSIIATNHRVALSLSVAERLAGDNRPTFICILRVDGEDNVVDMYLVHLLNENLSRILKRLRMEFATGTEALNKKNIYFEISAGQKVDLTPSGFKTALMEMIGADMNLYAEEKIRQRRTVGFSENDRYSMNITFEEMSPSDLIDGLLGLRDLGVKSLQPFEHRFDIKLPGGFQVPDGFERVILKIDPAPVNTGRILVSSPIFNAPIELPCNFIAPAVSGLPFNKIKIIARSKLVDALINMENGKVELKSNFDEISSHTVMDWLGVLNLWNAVYTKRARIQFQSASGKKLFSASIAEADVPKERPKHLDQMLKALEMTRGLLDQADSLGDIFSLRDVMESAALIQQTHQFFFHWHDLGEFSFEVSNLGALDGEEHQGLFVSTLNLGDNIYAYALKLVLELNKGEDSTKFRSKSMHPLLISRIEDDEAALNKFAAQATRLSGTSIMIMRTNKSFKDKEGS